MFENVYEIINKIESNKKFISDYSEKLKQISKGGHFIEEHHEVADIGIEARIRGIENKILYDNARIALYEEVMPKALEVWNKYAGKPYGEKTKEKIKNEVKVAAGCWFYAHSKDFQIIPDFDTDSKIYYFFNSRDIEVSPIKYGEKNFLKDNTIQHVELDEIRLTYCNAFVNNTYEEAKVLFKEIDECQKAFDSLERRVDKLNHRLPSSCDIVTLGYPRWWNIA